jgi:3,4-dihydroxy 2-butanone 4-phosphate synthase/GTP cyclohydrolase II
MKKISEKGHGLVIYLEQEGRGIGLANKLKTYKLQDQGLDTVDANTELGLPVDAREYWEAYQVLKHFDIHNIELLTNNPKKIQGLQKFGINVLRMPINTKPHHINHRYLDTKRRRLGHLLATEVLNSNPSNPGNIDESTNSYH